ncbi:MAG: rod shape-determining protein MreC [Candidatus Pacebacteria bacterium]|nr:rod shape-determining protein MreC [Candidatus Paceibacterota bacterium]
MSFHSKNNFNFNKRNNKTIKVSIFIVVLLIIIFSFSWSRNILFGLGSPFWNFKRSIVNSILSDVQILKSKRGLIEENLLLKEQISRETNDKIVSDLIKKENEDLKGILNRASNENNYILATVLIKPFLSAYDTLIVDVGSNDSIEVGSQVLANGNSFIGYVSEVYKNTSKIILYSSYGEKIPVLIGQNNIEKEAFGIGSGNFKVEMPRESDVKEGDNIVVPSISPNVFGIVEKVEFKATDSFKKILFKSPVNISELKWVEIVI